MEISSLFSLPEGVEIASMAVVDNILTLHLVATAPCAACPLCTQAATRIRSYYTRTLADVSCASRRVQCILHVRKFRCETSNCPRRVFAERLSPFIEPWARMTSRLSDTIAVLGVATCGELAERLAPSLGIRTSSTTVLRRIMALPTPSPEHVSLLGIDDWSFRRGRKFGTLLVDLATHTVIDMLPDRKTETVTAWLQLHPEIEIVSRDRGGDYAAAARLGAPQAQQVADRFHLAQNLTEIVEVILSRCRAEIRKTFLPAAISSDGVSQQELSLNEWHPIPDPHAVHAHLARQEERADWYQHLVELRTAGLTTKEIARRLHMAERTVRYWFSRGIPFEKKPNHHQKRRSCFDPYSSYVAERWNQGCHNGLHLVSELQKKGYKGSSRTVYRFLASLRENPTPPKGKAERAQVVPEFPLHYVTSQDAVWLFLRDHADLDETEQETLAALRHASPTAETLYCLVLGFMQMIRHLKGERLDTWLSQVRESQIPELQRFVRSIERDKAAVVAGLTLSYNNGLVEGKVNKLKLIKRMMFGRAGFALLRQRVLHAL